VGKITCKKIALGVAGLLLPCSLAIAAGLGKITVLSALGQPLRAEIEVVAPQPGEADSLSDVVADDAALIVRPARMTVKTVAHSAQFQHRLFPNGDKWVEKSRMNATVVEVRDNYVFKSVSTSAGYLFKTTNT